MVEGMVRFGVIKIKMALADSANGSSGKAISWALTV
jgi:hypothetical protein